MKRQLLIGRLGAGDRVSVPRCVDEQHTRLELLKRGRTLNYGIGGALVDLNALGIFPSEVGIDLLIVAAHVHAADTRISRTEQSQDSWTREIRLVVPVSDPGRWNSAAPTLTKALNFLTGDIWSIGFRARPRGLEALAPDTSGNLLATPFDAVSLFSGGLDSLIGAIDLLGSGATPLFVSHFGEGATSKAQSTLLDGLRKQYPDSQSVRLRVGMTFDNGLVKGVGSEKTTRGRSFLFFSLAVFAGTGLGKRFTVRVPENGLIALNVPLDPLRLGSNSTRTTHPFYMARWNDLLHELGIDGRLENPYWDKTKGEMVSGCSNAKLLSKLVPDSRSCSDPTKGRWKGLGDEHCGYCVPCLIRRAALDGAWGKGKDRTVYTVADLRGGDLRSDSSVGVSVRSFQYAIERMRANPGLANVLIHKPGSLTNESERLVGWAGVYRRGLAEVARLLVGVRTSPG